MFNIGGWEVVFILLLILLLWKPEELEARARQLGRWWAQITHSPWWRALTQWRYQAEDFLRQAAREANLEEAKRTFAETGRLLAEENELRAVRAYRPPSPIPEAPPVATPEKEPSASTAPSSAEPSEPGP